MIFEGRFFWGYFTIQFSYFEHRITDVEKFYDTLRPTFSWGTFS